MTTPIARVQVNGIEVGSLPRGIYEGIVQSVNRDRRLYIAYAVNFISVIGRVLGLILRTVPWLLFGALTLLVLLDPNSFTSLITELITAEPAQITEAVRLLLFFSFGGACFGLILLFFISPAFFAIHNPFDEAINRKIRSLLEVPAEGDLTVTFYDNATEQSD